MEVSWRNKSAKGCREGESCDECKTRGDKEGLSSLNANDDLFLRVFSLSEHVLLLRGLPLNYLKLYSLCDCTFSFVRSQSTYYTHFLAAAFVQKTYTCDSFSYGCSFRFVTLRTSPVNITADSRSSRSVVSAFGPPVNIGKIKDIRLAINQPLWEQQTSEKI